MAIRRSRLNIPIKLIEQLGNPSRVTCYFQGSDTILVPAPEFSLVMGHTWASVLFQDKAKQFRPYLIQGIYQPGKFKIETLGDIRYLRIKGSTFTHLSRKWLTHWSDV